MIVERQFRTAAWVLVGGAMLCAQCTHNTEIINYRHGNYPGAPRPAFGKFSKDLNNVVREFPDEVEEGRGLYHLGTDTDVNMPAEMGLMDAIDYLRDHDYETNPIENYVYLAMLKKVNFGSTNVLGLTVGAGNTSTEVHEALPSAVCYRNIWEFTYWVQQLRGEEEPPDEYDIIMNATKHELGHQFSAAKHEGGDGEEHCRDPNCPMYFPLDHISAYYPPERFCSLCWLGLGVNEP
jgi:hypothetical protein